MKGALQMAEDKSKTVIVKARAKAFLTSKPEESDPLITEPVRRRTSPKQQKSAHSAAAIAAAIRKGEKSEKGKNTAESPAADTKKSTAAVSVRQEPVINRKNKLTEGGRVKKLPACKMAEPMKRPADDTLIITGKVVAASKKIQTPMEAAKPAAVKTEEVKVVKPAAEQPAAKKEEPKKAAAKPVAKKAEPKKTAAKPAAKKAEPKKNAAKPAAKKAEPKKAAAKPAAKKAEPKKAAVPAAKKAELVKNTYIQYQNDTYKEADLIALAEKIWTKDMKKKAADLKTLELYVKPQEKMVYCVFNKKETGSFAI